MVARMPRLSGFLYLSSVIGLAAAVGPRITLHSWSLPTGSPEAVRGAGGIALKLQEPQIGMYLWLYEWNMFDAVLPGQHTHGTLVDRRQISRDGRSAVVESGGLSVSLRVSASGADVTLRVVNNSDHDWPEIAGVIPCFNPGPAASRTERLADEERIRTYFLTSSGLALLTDRSIHFNAKLRPRIERAAQGGEFVFSSKWPTSEIDATGGILIRESSDGEWVTGIAWDDFVSVQGHNPWKCMHACVRVGPLKRGAMKIVHGKVYLMRGSREDCLERYRREFP